MIGKNYHIEIGYNFKKLHHILLRITNDKNIKRKYKKIYKNALKLTNELRSILDDIEHMENNTYLNYYTKSSYFGEILLSKDNIKNNDFVMEYKKELKDKIQTKMMGYGLDFDRSDIRPKYKQHSRERYDELEQVLKLLEE
jgi:DNA repair ATPase RecN